MQIMMEGSYTAPDAGLIKALLRIGLKLQLGRAAFHTIVVESSGKDTHRELIGVLTMAVKKLPISALIAAGLRRDYSAVRRPICSIRASVASFG
jgi:hypothetical protein